MLGNTAVYTEAPVGPAVGVAQKTVGDFHVFCPTFCFDTLLNPCGRVFDASGSLEIEITNVVHNMFFHFPVWDLLLPLA